MADKIELSEDPASTYGATPEYIEAWNEQYGKKAAEDVLSEESEGLTGVVENSPGIVAEQKAKEEATPNGPGTGTTAAQRSK
jgi:hypothetical protein